MNVNEAIHSVLAEWGAHPCFLELRPGVETVGTTAEQCASRIHDLAHQLKAWGIRRRQLVPIFLENSTDFIFVFLSLLEIGAVPVLAKMDYRRLELEQVFRNAQPQAVISEEQHLRELKPFLVGDQTVVTHVDKRFFLYQGGSNLPARDDVPEDIASINYTYRGYGYPLGAMVSHSQYLHGARLLQTTLQSRSCEKMLVILPMSHIFTLVGCILAPLLYRMTSAIACTLHPRRLFDYIRDLRIDHVTSVPEIYEMLYRLHDQAFELGSLKTFVSGGSLLSPDSYENIRRAFSIDLLHGYGLTEFTPISGNQRGQARSGTVGPICEGIECRIMATDGKGRGEIQVRTPFLTRSYYRRPKESAETWEDGWFRTGDLGRMEDGHLVFDRELKKTRKINGNIVDLEEIRRAILCDRDVSDVQLEWQSNTLSARLAVSRQIDFEGKAEQLRAFLRDHIAGYKIPKHITRP